MPLQIQAPLLIILFAITGAYAWLPGKVHAGAAEVAMTFLSMAIGAALISRRVPQFLQR